MSNENWITLDDLAAKWAKDPENVLAEFRQRPYFAVAQDIYELRLEMGLTQAEAAERAQTHQSRVSKLENADLDFKLSTLIKIAEALGAHVDIRVVKNIIEPDDVYLALFTAQASTGKPGQHMTIQPEVKVNPIIQKEAAKA